MSACLKNKVNDKWGVPEPENVILVIIHPFHEVDQLQMAHNIAIHHLHVN